jgi:hypothetical protein
MVEALRFEVLNVRSDVEVAKDTLAGEREVGYAAIL